jgi:hypothetical protein
MVMTDVQQASSAAAPTEIAVGEREYYGTIVCFIFNLKETEEFLSKLDPKNKDRFTFQTFDDDASRKDPSLARKFHGSLADNQKQLCRLNTKGAGAFVTINETDLRGREAKDVVRIRAVFADFDDGWPEKFHVQPHILVQSSSRGGHAYFLMKDCTVDQFRELQAQIIAHYGCDPKIKDPSRVMRLPGLYHRKDIPYRSHLLLMRDHEPFTVEEFKVGLKPKAESSNGGTVLNPAEARQCRYDRRSRRYR